MPQRNRVPGKQKSVLLMASLIPGLSTIRPFFASNSRERVDVVCDDTTKRDPTSNRGAITVVRRLTVITTTMALGVGISIGIAKERFHQARDLQLNRGDGAKHVLAGFTREVNAISSRVASLTGGKKKVVRIKVVKGSKSKKKGKGKKTSDVVVVDEAGTLICTT